MIKARLEEAILAENIELTKENVQKAAFWYNKQKIEFPDEVEQIRFTDIAEGHASYIQYFSTIAYKNLITREDAKEIINTGEIEASLGKDSYPLGLLSLYLSELRDPNFKNTFFSIC